MNLNCLPSHLCGIYLVCELRVIITLHMAEDTTLWKFTLKAHLADIEFSFLKSASSTPDDKILKGEAQNVKP